MKKLSFSDFKIKAEQNDNKNIVNELIGGILGCCHPCVTAYSDTAGCTHEH